MGGHGGASAEETSTALLLLSPVFGMGKSQYNVTVNSEENFYLRMKSGTWPLI